jgi:hypothetical protein
MNRIREIWSILESKSNQPTGLDKVRFSGESGPDLYLGINYPDRNRLLLLRTSAGDSNLPENRQFKGLKLEKIYDTSRAESIFLSLVLADHNFSDIFDSIIADIAETVLINEAILASLKFTERIEKWQAVFERFGSDGLSRSEQYGLYGELFLLCKLLGHVSDPDRTLKSWTGPHGTVHDFQYGGWSVEVKTSIGNRHQKVYISNERQLDTSTAGELYLYHLSLDVKQKAGETLNNLVDAILKIISGNAGMSTRFRTMLNLAGYFEHHQALYENSGYSLRQEMYYRVEGEFPRIEEKDIRDGIGEVKYSIVVSGLSDFTVPEALFLQRLDF